MSNVAKIERDQPTPAVTMNPQALIQLAVEKGANVDQLERLMALQERWEANEARKAFGAALAAFKAAPPSITKNKHVAFGNTKYDHATLDNVADTIGASLTPHGLSHRWEVEQTADRIRVSCVLQHVQGHAERVSMEAPADSSGQKNSIQAIGSTVTYLQRYTLLAATGMAAKGMDDDGGGSNGSRMDEKKLADHLAAIDTADGDTLFSTYKKPWQEAEKLGDKHAMKLLTEHKDRRKQKLGAKS